jgi:hypothetical protein
VSYSVKLVGATREAGKIPFKILNRGNGLPVKSAYVDEETGDMVVSEDQIKGYEGEKDDFFEIRPDEIKKLKRTSHTRNPGLRADRRLRHPLPGTATDPGRRRGGRSIRWSGSGSPPDHALCFPARL